MPPSIENPVIRRCARVLRAVHELHRKGYQRLRVIPYFGSTNHWRCVVTYSGAVCSQHGAWGPEDGYWCAKYTSAMGNEYFEWPDAKNDTAVDLAAKLLDRFPHLRHLGAGRDWSYVGWYTEMMTYADRGELPVAVGFDGDADPRFLPTTEFMDSGLPMPPGGELPPLDPSHEHFVYLPRTKPLDPAAPVRTIRYSNCAEFMAHLDE